MRFLAPSCLFAALVLLRQAYANSLLQTAAFHNCVHYPNINLQKLNISLDTAASRIRFDIQGTNPNVQNVSATLFVSAYGATIYKNTFDPCDPSTLIRQLCPVPAGVFAAQGSHEVPSEVAARIPSIAFKIPDLEGEAILQLNPAEGGPPLACIKSDISNGKTLTTPAISYIALGIAGIALIMSGVSALSSIGVVGAQTSGLNFGTLFLWFQSIQMNGMMSVKYPPVYRAFAKNFAFSGLLVPIAPSQTMIDQFRSFAGGDLSQDNSEYLQHASLTFTAGTSTAGVETEMNMVKRAQKFSPLSTMGGLLNRRDESSNLHTMLDANRTSITTTTQSDNKMSHFVHGIQAYSEQLSIPQSNTFMTVLLMFAIVVAAIVVAILLFKIILELWALMASFPNSLRGFRKRYWGIMGRTITNLVLLLYGIWTLYCVFQFTNGDSWAAQTLATVTLAIFTALLLGFTFRIWQIAQRWNKAQGDASGLYDDKETWRKYSLFYDNYKRAYWWIFIPVIFYMFAKGCVIAGANGHGLVQASGQLIVESLMLVLILWCRPFVTTSGNILNIVIQFVRVLSVICILVFVEELGVPQTTKTVTGIVLISVQSFLTVVLTILLAINGLIICFRQNPHRKDRKDAEKGRRVSRDDLTPLSPHQSLLLPSRYPSKYRSYHSSTSSKSPNLYTGNCLSPLPALPSLPASFSSTTTGMTAVEGLPRPANHRAAPSSEALLFDSASPGASSPTTAFTPLATSSDEKPKGRRAVSSFYSTYYNHFSLAPSALDYDTSRFSELPPMPTLQTDHHQSGPPGRAY